MKSRFSKLMLIGLGLVFAFLLMQGTLLESAAQVPKDIFIFGTTSETRTVDPQDSVDNISWRSIYYNYDRLVRYKGSTTEVEPMLAVGWDISPDGKTYTFHLREGVKFIDGTPFNAEAVKFSFTRLLELGLAASGLLKGIVDLEGIEVVDEYTFRFHLNFPFAPFLGSLASDQASIVSPGIMEHEVNDDYARAWLAEHTAGTGPFHLTEWRRGDVMILKRNDAYWGPAPHFKEVHIKFVPDPAVLRDTIEVGDIDMGETLTADQLDALSTTPGLRVIEEPSFLASYLYMNNQREFLSNPLVREAISFAIDYEGIIEGVTLGRAIQMRGPIPKGMDGHDETVFQYSRDLERARQLLELAGHPDGFEIGLLIDPGFPDWVAIASIVKANLAEIGIKVNIDGFARATMRDMLDKGDFDMATGFWTPDYPDADMFTWFWFLSENWGLAGNRSFYDNRWMDELVVAQREETDPTKRLEIFKKIQTIAVADAAYVYLYQANYRLAMRDNVKGYVYNPMLLNMPNFDTMQKE
ncbi:MAG: ABC transporter substrate-binding protein [Candidatus Bipolaricaulia bacterium]